MRSMIAHGVWPHRAGASPIVFRRWPRHTTISAAGNWHFCRVDGYAAYKALRAVMRRDPAGFLSRACLRRKFVDKGVQDVVSFAVRFA